MDQSGSDLVAASYDPPVATLTLNRPQAHNALNTAVLERLDDHLSAIAADRSIRAVVITGQGERAFSAGADLDELQQLSGVAARLQIGRGQAVMRRLETLGVPSIAAVRGWALGGGFELALSCSLIVAGRSARFGLPEAGLGLMPGYGGTQRLTHTVGRKAATAIMLTGKPLDAARAWELGLLACPPVDDDALGSAAAELAAQIATRSPSATRLILDAVDASTSSDAALRHETALAAVATSSADAAEGIDAFLGKRDPVFSRHD